MKKTLTALALSVSLLSAEGQASAQENISAKEKIERQVETIAKQVKTIKGTGYKIDNGNNSPFNCSTGKELELDIENDIFDVTIFTYKKLKELGFIYESRGNCDEAQRIANGNLEIIKELIDGKNSTNPENNSRDSENNSTNTENK